MEFAETIFLVINDTNIKKCEQILIDNGIDEDEACTVLQAIGYALLDMEFYPKKQRLFVEQKPY